MMAHSPHRRWKGHCMLCAPYPVRGNGWIKKMPFSVARKLGRKRRTKRGYDPEKE